MLDPFTNPLEHGLTDKVELIERFRAAEEYTSLFTSAFTKKLSQANTEDIAQALSAYINFLKPKDIAIRLQHYLNGQDKAALTEAEQYGLELFRGQARCSECHSLAVNNISLTDGQYHSRAIDLSRLSPRLAQLIKAVAAMPFTERFQNIATDKDIAALGRFVITLQPSDIGKFKTPSLWEVATTSPYMHDGSLTTLKQAIDWELYYQGQNNKPVITLSKIERGYLLAFLKTLTSTPKLTPENYSGAIN